MTDKKGIVLLIVLILIALAIGQQNIKFPQSLFPLFSVVSDLKQEYTTIWGSDLDGGFDTSTCYDPISREDYYSRLSEIQARGYGCISQGVGGYYGDRYFEDKNFIIQGKGRAFTNSDKINIVPELGGMYIKSKQKFKGQEIVLVFNGNRFSFLGQESKDEIIKIILRPHTLEPTRWDVIRHGDKIGEITADESGYLTLMASVQSDNIDKGNGAIYYIGYKAQFECDLAPDERPIAQSFASAFSQKDLEFPVTKWMYPCRPATLRDLAQGEQPLYPNPYPSLNKGDITPVPPNSFITVHYATPNVAGIEQSCDPATSAYTKIGNTWVCQKLVPTATTIIREIPIREIIKVTGTNQFSFTTTNKKSFNIGSSTFTADEQFTCSFPNDIDNLQFPNPSSDCYSTKINYEGKSYTLKDKELLNLSKDISVQYFAQGGLQKKNDGIENKLSGAYIFNVEQPLNIEVTGGLSIKQGTIQKIPISIKNMFTKNEIKLKISQKVKNTNQILQDKIILLNANQGDNNYEVEIDTLNLGVNEITLQAFYPVIADANVLLPSDKIIINVEVLGESSIIKFVDREKLLIGNEQPTQAIPKQTFFSTIPLWVKVVGGIIVGILLFWWLS